MKDFYESEIETQDDAYVKYIYSLMFSDIVNTKLK